jgi:predicted GTPase
MLDRPIVLAVVGHVNAGKTSLIRTLARSADFGEIDDAPGTTRAPASVLRPFKDGDVTLRLDDTPGLGDPVALDRLLRDIPAGLGPADRLRAFLKRPEAVDDLAPEAAALRTMLEADAAVYVIDTREAVLPKFTCEMAILSSAGKPLVCVLNHADNEDSRHAQWAAALNQHGISVQVGLDAAVPGLAALRQFYRSVTTVLAASRPESASIETALQREITVRHQEGLRSIADGLVSLAAMRRTLSSAEVSDEAKRAERIAQIHAEVMAEARSIHDALLRIQGHRVGDAHLTNLPGLSGRWETDLFDREALKVSAEKFGTGAAIGAAVGLGLDIALAGLSLGVGTSIGAALGGTAGQGFAPAGRALKHVITGEQDVRIEDAVLLLLCERLVHLLSALEQRGHGAVGPAAARAGDAPPELTAASVMEVLARARSHPDWAAGEVRNDSANRRRQRVVDELVAVLETTAGLRLEGPASVPRLV